MLKELIIKNRSYRRFIQSERISEEQLKNWIDLARLSASARNSQALKYVLITEEELCNKIFPNLGWAGYLKDWKGPEVGEQPAAYIVMLYDKTITDNYFCDDGIAAQSILLGAVEEGFGGCIIGSVNRPKVGEILNIPAQYEIIQLIALGKPSEEVVVDNVVDDDIKYWRDENQVHHVPKRSLNEIILK